jgi:hypothetical protein
MQCRRATSSPVCIADGIRFRVAHAGERVLQNRVAVADAHADSVDHGVTNVHEDCVGDEHGLEIGRTIGGAHAIAVVEILGSHGCSEAHWECIANADVFEIQLPYADGHAVAVVESIHIAFVLPIGDADLVRDDAADADRQ